MIERQNPKTLVNNLVVDTKALANDHIALAKAEMIPAAKAAGVGGGMFGAAGYLGANAVSLLFMAGGLAFGLLLAHQAGWGVLASTALGFVIMAVILLIIAGILAMIGKKKIGQVGPPEKTIAEAKKSVETLKGSLNSGVAQVDADIRDRKATVQAKRAAKDLDEAQEAAPASTVTAPVPSTPTVTPTAALRTTETGGTPTGDTGAHPAN